jgi:hypothetical protein
MVPDPVYEPASPSEIREIEFTPGEEPRRRSRSFDFFAEDLVPEEFLEDDDDTEVTKAPRILSFFGSTDGGLGPERTIRFNSGLCLPFKGHSRPNIENKDDYESGYINTHYSDGIYEDIKIDGSSHIQEDDATEEKIRFKNHIVIVLEYRNEAIHSLILHIIYCLTSIRKYFQGTVLVLSEVASELHRYNIHSSMFFSKFNIQATNHMITTPNWAAAA